MLCYVQTTQARVKTLALGVTFAEKYCKIGEVTVKNIQKGVGQQKVSQCQKSVRIKHRLYGAVMLQKNFDGFHFMAPYHLTKSLSTGHKSSKD